MTEPSMSDAPGAEIVQFRPRNSLDSKLTYARAMAESALLPQQYRGKPANMLWAMEYAEMLGLAPMAAVTGIHVIEGKPTASAALISALVRRAGHRLRITGNDQKAVAEIVRSDDPDYTFRSEWTIERAKQANLTGKSVWKQYPAAMLKARAITEVARDACEEALSGVRHTAEELGVDVNEEGEPTTVVEQIRPEAVQAEPVVEVDWDAEIANCNGDKTALGALWKRAPKDSDARTKIQAAATNPKVVEDPPLIVDAELVEDAPPVRSARPSKLDTAKAANDIYNSLLDCADFDEAERLATTAPRVDVTGFFTDEIREVLDIGNGDRLKLPEFAQLVADYINRRKVSVNAAINGEAA
jgi:hypothetical protein